MAVSAAGKFTSFCQTRAVSAILCPRVKETERLAALGTEKHPVRIVELFVNPSSLQFKRVPVITG